MKKKIMRRQQRVKLWTLHCFDFISAHPGKIPFHFKVGLINFERSFNPFHMHVYICIERETNLFIYIIKVKI